MNKEKIIKKVNLKLSSKKKLFNSFSLQMLNSFPSTIEFEEVTIDKEELKNYESYIGHADTAEILGVDLNRSSASLSKGDTFLIAQLVGGRLPEGTKVLPEGYKFKFIKGTVK